MSVPDPARVDLRPLLEAMAANGAGGLTLPPPIVETLGQEFTAYDPGDPDDGHLGASMTSRFPVLEAFQNPMGMLQGGMIATLADGVVGPLSYLVAPPSVTSQMTVTYLQPVTPDLAHVEVEARLVSRAGRQLVFDATVRTPDGTELALARLTQTVVRRRPS